METPEQEGADATPTTVRIGGTEYTVYTKDGGSYYFDGKALYTILNNHTNDGDLTVAAKLTQNMDGKFKGYLGAQALAGAVSGSGGSFSIGGAVAVIVSKARTGVVFESAQSAAEGTAVHERLYNR